MLRNIAIALACAAVCCGSEAFRLLPQPSEVKPSQGSLPLRNVTIGFSRPPDADDEAAARGLTRVLEQQGVKATRSSRPLISLVRTGTASSWTWDDAAGPESIESYTLKVTTSGVTLSSPSARGLFYAAQTLRQLIRQEGGVPVLPLVEIKDWPGLRLRGFMLDLSHGPFPKFEELKRQIDFLALWKANQFYLYSETNIELDGFPLLSPQARLTKSQVRELVAYARERFIDVVPCVELYGHLHDLVRIEKYSKLGETAHGGEIDPRSPEALKLVGDWVDQLIDLFPSPYFHVGLDETYELGKMPGRQLEPANAGALYLSFFEQVSRLVAGKGKRVMVWGDIILQHPEVIPKLPQGTIAIPWRYQDEPDYDRFVQPLAAAKVHSLLGSGVWNYYEAAPDFDHTIRNVDGLVKSARKHGSLGLLHTEWTDCGQVLMRAANPAVAYGPIAAWNQQPISREEFYDRYARLQHPAQAKAVSRLLATISESQALLEKALGTRVMTALWADPLHTRTLNRVRKNEEQIIAGRLKAEEAQEILLAIGPDRDPMFDDLLFGARLLDYVALRQIYAFEFESFQQALSRDPKRQTYRLLYGIESSDHTHSRLFDLMDAAGELQAQFRGLWLRDYVPYRLETAMGRWRAEFERWRSLQEGMSEGYRDYRDGNRAPDLVRR